MPVEAEITDADISAISAIMRRDFSDDERVRVLKRMTSCDVQACPGSGKTTLLVAKLAILASKMPQGHRGICVLSHTNAARIEIESTVGSYASRLFSYPHFVGTIQSFVDRFLAIPAMVERFGIRPWAIDDDTFAARARACFVSLPPPAKTYLERASQKNPQETLKTLTQLRHSFQSQEICCYDNGKETRFPIDPAKPAGKALIALKVRISQEGCIGYHDAYSWANWYLDRHPSLSKVIAIRFPLVFFDEMQDTDFFQWTLLKRVFAESQLIQCFGDANQAIYSERSLGAESGWQRKHPIQISSTHRLSRSIAKLSEGVCIQPQSLRSLSGVRDCRHTVFLFDRSTVGEVIPAFARLIADEGLADGSFKAVGRIGVAKDEPDQFTISSYWPGYGKRLHAATNFPTLQDYFHAARMFLTQDGHTGKASECLIRGLVQLLRISNAKDAQGRFWTTETFLRLAEKSNAAVASSHVRKQLLAWCHRLTEAVDLDWNAVKNEVDALFRPFLITKLNKDAEAFFQTPSVTPIAKDNSAAFTNIYHHNTSTGRISIEIDTIHGVKGQSHQATLLLQTYFRQVHDLPRLVPYLAGYPPRKPDSVVQSRLSLVFVAMTRPTHLLCLAICKDHISKNELQNLDRWGWTLHEV